jgi:hypothetical protein
VPLHQFGGVIRQGFDRIQQGRLIPECRTEWNAKPRQSQGNRLNKLLTSYDFSESTVVRAPDFRDFACPALEKSTARPTF